MISFETLSLAPSSARSQYRGVRRLMASRPDAVSFWAVALVLSMILYALITQMRTSSIYQARRLDLTLKTLEDDIAKNRALQLKSAQKPDPVVEELLAGMQEAGVGISFIHANTAFVDASRPQP